MTATNVKIKDLLWGKDLVLFSSVSCSILPSETSHQKLLYMQIFVSISRLSHRHFASDITTENCFMHAVINFPNYIEFDP